jgi:hypothetical protein
MRTSFEIAGSSRALAILGQTVRERFPDFDLHGHHHAACDVLA